MTASRINPGFAAAALLALLLGYGAAEFGPKLLLLAVATPCALLLMARPQWCFWLLVASIPVTVELGSGVTVTKLLVPLVIASVLVNAVMRRCPWPNPIGSVTAVTGTVFFAVVGLSVVLATLGTNASFDSIRANRELGAYATRMLLFVLTLSMLRSDNDVRNVSIAIVVAAVVEALVVIAQVHFRLVLPGDWRAAAISNVEGTTGDFRAEGTTAHPIYLAGYLQMVLPFAVLVPLRAKPLGRIIAVVCCALLLYAWSLAVSRSSMLGIVAMVATALCVWSRVGRALVLSAAVVFLLALAAHGWNLTDLAQTIEQLRHFGQGLRADQLQSTASSLQFRLESSAGGWNLFLANPFTGVGLGQAIHVYMAYLPAWATSPFHPQDIHNAFLGVAAETGFLGLGALLALWGLALRGIHAAWNDAVLGAYARTLLVVLVGQAVFLALTPMVRDMWFTVPLGAALGQIMQTRMRARTEAGAKAVPSAVIA